MANLTRRGALNVTSDLDRIANLFQHHHETLGIPQQYALKFAYHCDILSDTIEKHAVALSKRAEEEGGAEPEEKEEKEEAKKEAGCEKLPEGGMRDNCEKKQEEAAGGDKAEKKEASAKKADDETGLSVDHGASGFDANVIADEVSGPLEILQPVESWMKSYFDQNWFSQLREKQQGGDIGFFVSASQARLRRLAASSALSGLADLLLAVHAKLEASSVAEVKALAGDVKKQLDAVAKVRDLMVEQQATGMVEPQVVAAADTVLKAVSEQLPYLQQVLAGVDGGSPVALLEFQKLLGGGSIKELIGLGTTIVVDATKGLGKKDEGKEAAAKAAEEAPKDEKKDEKKDEEPVKEASRKSAEESEDEDEKSEGEDKSASLAATFGYNLFAN